MRQGLHQEPELIEGCLAQTVQMSDSPITAEKCGFIVTKTHPFLGASPGDIVTDNGNSGLLEMKYIQVLRNQKPYMKLLKERKFAFLTMTKQR